MRFVKLTNRGQVKKITEDQLQIQVMDLASTHPILRKWLIHIPNGGSRHIAEAVKLKRMGVKRGVSDLLLAYPTAKYSGMWIELKISPNSVTEDQRHWLDDMEWLGYKIAIIKDDAVKAYQAMIDYLYED